MTKKPNLDKKKCYYYDPRNRIAMTLPNNKVKVAHLALAEKENLKLVLFVHKDKNKTSKIDSLQHYRRV